MKIRIKSGRLSDLAEAGSRDDWSELNARLRNLEPGKTLEITCPPSRELRTFRSMIITRGRRYHTGEYRMGTRTHGQVIYCFLEPR